MKNKIARVISMLIAASTLSASLASCSWNEVRETKSMLQKYREYDVSSDEYGYDIDLTEYILAPSYLGIEIPDISYSPSEADIENYTALKQAYFSDEERVNEPAQKYDFVDCEYSAVLYFSGEDTDETAEDDEGATERKSYNYSLFDSSVDNSRTSVMVGVDHFMVPEIDDAMIGMKPGESKTVEFTLPEPYYKDVMSSGLSGEFTIKVNHVRRNDLAEFTDEFVTDHYGAASVESYRDTMVQELVHNMENYYNGYEYDLLEDYLASNTMVYKYPSAQLNAERDAIYDSYRDRAESAGMTLDDYIVSIGYSDSADFFDSYVDPQARLKIREDMIFLFVARCEGLTVSQSEYEDALTAEGSEYDASDISTCEEIVVKKYGSILRFKQQVQNSK
ncbi:MAG: hypothetical protein IJQ80_03060, partial [Clostridia bacterium]|nr:hypothetical protein [Clostridia bacterium]